MKLPPITVFGLIYSLTIRVGLRVIAGMAAYVGTVAQDLFYCFFSTGSLFGRLKNVSHSLPEKNGSCPVDGVYTASSAGIIPHTMATAENRLNVQPPIVRFIVLLGAAIKMNGKAI